MPRVNPQSLSNLGRTPRWCCQRNPARMPPSIFSNGTRRTRSSCSRRPASDSLSRKPVPDLLLRTSLFRAIRTPMVAAVAVGVSGLQRDPLAAWSWSWSRMATRFMLTSDWTIELKTKQEPLGRVVLLSQRCMDPRQDARPLPKSLERLLQRHPQAIRGRLQPSQRS